MAAELFRICTAHGVVVASTASHVEIDLEPPPPCAGCNGACRWYTATSSRQIAVATRDAFAVGTAVTVRVADRELLRNAAIVYGVPLASVLGGALLGYALSGSDRGTAAGAGAALAAALVLIRGVRAHLERRAQSALSVVAAPMRRQ